MRRVESIFMLQFVGKRCAVCGSMNGTVGHHLNKSPYEGWTERVNIMALCLRHHAMAHDDSAFNDFLKKNREKEIL